MFYKGGALFQVLIYISIPFLLIFLFEGGYFTVPNIERPLIFLLSLFFLLLGFLFSSITWKQTFKLFNIEIGFKSCFASTGLSIFGKYIPGKIWVVIGRAEYIAWKNAVPRKQAASASLLLQLLDILLGSIVGSFSIFFIDSEYFYSKGFPLWLIIIAIIVSVVALVVLGRIFLRKSRKERLYLASGIFRTGDFYLTFILGLSGWLLWVVAFILFVESIFPGQSLWYTSFAFVFAGIVGILALIMPGGIGVREGAMVFLMVGMGVPSSIATTIAIASRLWFLFGELLFFIFGFASGYSDRKLR